MATIKNTTLTPATEGPDVIYSPETGDWSAYANGQYIDSFANSQAAWSAARSAVFNPQPIADVIGTSDGSTNAYQAMVQKAAEKIAKTHTPPSYLKYLDAAESMGLEHEAMLGADITVHYHVTDEGTPDEIRFVDYCTGDVCFSVPDEPAEPAALLVDGYDHALSPSQARDLLRVLLYPAVYKWMGLDGSITPDFIAGMQAGAFIQSAPIQSTPHICDDKVNARTYAQHIWTDYCAGTDSQGSPTEITIYEPISTNERNVPMLYAFGLDGIPLDEVERVLPQIIALLNDPTVQAARQRWAELVATRQAMNAA